MVFSTKPTTKKRTKRSATMTKAKRENADFSALLDTTKAGDKSMLNNDREYKVQSLETESKFINKNLTTLGRIFAILSNRKLQVKNTPPYRESKLTRLLASSLQYDNCKTLMIVNVQQTKETASATKESLEFASKAMIAF